LLKRSAWAMPAITTGAVCVYHDLVATAVERAGGHGIPVAAVSTGFPAGLSPLDVRLREIEASVSRARGRSTSSSPANMC
jgi:deoxyribose-phosphate aldolase